MVDGETKKSADRKETAVGKLKMITETIGECATHTKKTG